MGAFLCLVAMLQSPAAPAYRSADIYLFTSADGRTEYDDALHIPVRDAKQASRLASYFPGLGGEAKSLRPSGWRAWGSITFHPGRGKDINLDFSLDGKTWSEPGKTGDHAARPGLRAYMVRLTRAYSAKSSTRAHTS